eukprot:2587107-Amphidinium_carterae.1
MAAPSALPQASSTEATTPGTPRVPGTPRMPSTPRSVQTGVPAEILDPATAAHTESLNLRA